MAGNQSVILFRTHFLLNLLKNANFSTRMPIFVCILIRACPYACYTPVHYTPIHAYTIKVNSYGTETTPTC